jgi:hypothetical protein
MVTCRINEKGIFVNDELIVSGNLNGNWINNYYTTINLNYPKFYKMDDLSKLSILAVESMKIKKNPFLEFNDDEISMIFANKNTSFDTDKKFIQSYKELGNPGPALFVYTLPNILIGELSIMNKWYGENTFFILNEFDANFFIQQCMIYINNGNKACLCGWVDTKEDKEDCFLFFIEKNDLINVTEIELSKKYNFNKK